MNTKIKMMNKVGKQVNLPTGYSLTTLFFGWIPSLVRLDIKSFLIIFGSSFALSYLMIDFQVDEVTSLVFSSLLNAVFGYYRNTWLIESYLKKGYKFISGQDMSKEELDTLLGFETTTTTWM